MGFFYSALPPTATGMLDSFSFEKLRTRVMAGECQHPSVVAVAAQYFVVNLLTLK